VTYIQLNGPTTVKKLADFFGLSESSIYDYCADLTSKEILEKVKPNYVRFGKMGARRMVDRERDGRTKPATFALAGAQNGQLRTPEEATTMGVLGRVEQKKNSILA